ncbi:MAG TPA: sulfatase-like hydrolase/transferase, partial [Parvularculaceae bacterium]|nr:sulfatase-like hydrolase/transferase [Parvularculaceae bacterium]
MKFTLAIIAGFISAALSPGCAGAANAVGEKPNIVIILADDLGYGDIGANGAQKIRTPHIDAIARRGVNFTQFYASANVCSPSRAGLMTGRYPIRSGLAYDVIGADDSRGLPAAEETLGELARRAGYATKFIGKWHLGKFPDYLPLKHGFDEFFG